jgi:hypothetical protein
MMNVEQAIHPFNAFDFVPKSLKYHSETGEFMDNINSGCLNRFKSFPLIVFSCENKDLG